MSLQDTLDRVVAHYEELQSLARELGPACPSMADVKSRLVEVFMSDVSNQM